MVRLYEGLGARVLDGGPTLNPSTYELLAGIHDVPAHEVVVLPNSPNVIMAAERAAELSEKPARVVPTTAAQEGLAALLSFDPREACERQRRRRGRGDRRACRWAGSRPRPRTTPRAASRAGQAVGYAGDELVAWGDPAETFAETVRRVAADAELLTVLAGEDAPLDEQALEALMPEGVELDFQQGDQPAWWWLLSAECTLPSASADHLHIATAFASTDELELDAELRSLPRPSRLGEPVDAAGQGRQGAGLAGDRDRGRPAGPPAPRARRARPARRWPTCGPATARRWR